ncbi:uncharacterized protein MYCFIDRAFT_179866 [Pseudocercospora fijiensis CIRAD86]|uniref:Uncharacterized protein n=1 Tax=Pseudocercospora fijiensis (strain CIRAD86) TaxID=383855 RepID=M2ZYT7_PSEFD|nr:uncharacterized protein MYCFIDRAFT_179866 [Pseudocercospora fijiensis CIRAD86]EME77286.1 hypothetical protein MYCFIDRAFT_179866 [Pseudocercospora fijiensis CIRAD86]
MGKWNVIWLSSLLTALWEPCCFAQMPSGHASFFTSYRDGEFVIGDPVVVVGVHRGVRGLRNHAARMCRDWQ